MILRMIFIYIPADFDIDLFSNQTIEEFNNVVNFVKNNDEVNAIFPNCIPYYYDIHALRRNGWNSKDSWKIYNKLSKYFPIGKFFKVLFDLPKTDKNRERCRPYQG